MFQAGGHVAGTSCSERAVCEASWAIESERMVRGSPEGPSEGSPKESPGSPSGRGFRGDSMTEIQGLTKAITKVTVTVQAYFFLPLSSSSENHFCISLGWHFLLFLLIFRRALSFWPIMRAPHKNSGTLLEVQQRWFKLTEIMIWSLTPCSCFQC